MQVQRTFDLTVPVRMGEMQYHVWLWRLRIVALEREYRRRSRGAGHAVR